MKKIYFLILFLSFTISAFGQTTEPGTTQSEQLSSRAWYILRQLNAGPLLLGLPQRLGKAIESSQRNDFLWTGTEEGGSLKLNITVEGDVTGEIYIGLFKDPYWSAEPVQLRSFQGPGEYVINNLPVGKFQIGAMIGSLPVATAIGVQQMWPKSVEIERGITGNVKVLISRDFQLRASGSYNNTISKDFIGDWKDMDTENLLQGHVTGPDGQAIAFATVQIREYNPGARSIKAPNRGTNVEGYYKCDNITWPYTVGVCRYKLMPSILGYCYQYLYYNHVFQECETVDFQFENYPVGNAGVKGRVLDNKGKPLREFFIDASTKMDWEVMENPDDKFYKVTGYHVPFISEDGSYKLDNLPEGDFYVRAIPFNNRVYESHRREEIGLEAGKTTNIDIRIVSKNILYGRVLFRDGSPAVIKPTPWLGAKTSILLPMGPRALGVAELDDEGYFSVNLSDKEVELLKSGKSRLIINVPTSEERRRKTMGDFPFEKLATDKNNAGVLTIERPDQKPLSLMGKPLPEFEGMEIEFDAKQVEGKMHLVCFFDMEQRPSRNCIMQLSKRAQEFATKDVVVVAVQASIIEQQKLVEFIKENDISFPVGMIRSNEEKVRKVWGIRFLPWLILTDKKQAIRAEGFSVTELDQKVGELENVEQ